MSNILYICILYNTIHSLVAGKSQFWLCWNCCFDLLFIAIVIIITQNGLPQRILPLCLTVKLKCLCLEPYPPVDGRKEEIDISPCQRLAILGGICKIIGLFTLFPHLPHLLPIEEPGLRPREDGCLRHQSAICLGSQLALPSRTSLYSVTVIICNNMYFTFQILFHYRLFQDVEYSCLCYTVGSCSVQFSRSVMSGFLLFIYYIYSVRVEV